MKNFVVGILVFGFTSLCFAQQSDQIKPEVLPDVIITPLNTTYLSAVQSENTPKRVKNLQDKAARFNITELPIFDHSFEAYEVIFSEDKNKIIATYDKNGKIQQSFEKFKDVSLPYEVRNSIALNYPGWDILGDTYVVNYYSDKTIKKEYKIKIRNDKTTKRLKINHEGKVK